MCPHALFFVGPVTFNDFAHVGEYGQTQLGRQIGRR